MSRALVPGDALGRFRIVEALGAGAVGEVYEADDTRLGRRVAIEVLPAGGDEARRREAFEREVRAAAAVSHPNLVAAHSVEEVDGLVFVVMERLRGRPLSALIPPRGLPRERFLALAIPLADAVGAAHRQGIVHGDLQPRRVCVDDDGHPKVLGFGLSKGGAEVAPDGGATTATGAGVVGTAAYVSPEKAQGLPVDARSDIFSLGAVLFEMATGRPPFDGDSNLARVTAILRDPAPRVGRGLDGVVGRCLEKEPGRRYQSAIDLKLDLEALRDRPARRPWGVAAIAAALALGVAATWLGARRAAAPPAGPRVARLTPLTGEEGPELSPSLSPDGTWFVYSRRGHGNMDVYRQRVGGENAMNLTADSPADEEDPAISPDGERIAFYSTRGDGLYVMGATGESVRKLTSFGRHPAWSPDGTRIAFCSEKVQLDTALYRGTSAVWVVTVATGELREVAPATAAQPAFSPHGDRIAFFRVDERGVRDLWTVRADGTDPVRLTDDPAVDWNPVWSPDGKWLYFASDRGGVTNLWRLPMDEPAGRATGAPEPVTVGSGAREHSISFSRDGSRLLFVADTTRYTIRRAPFDPATEAVTGPSESVATGSSPSVRGDEVAFETVGRDHVDLALAHVDGIGRRLLTEDAFHNLNPQWSPDGARISFRSDRDGKYQCWAIHPDGGGLQRLTDVPGGVEGRRCLWSPDGKQMAARVDGGQVAFFDPDRPWGGQTPRIVPAPAKDVAFTPYAWAPDGRSIVGFAIPASASYRTLTLDVAAGTYAEMPVVASLAAWLSDSQRVLYQLGGQIEIADLRTGRHHPVLPDAFEGIGNFTLSADQRFLYYELIALETDVWMATLQPASREDE